ALFQALTKNARPLHATSAQHKRNATAPPPASAGRRSPPARPAPRSTRRRSLYILCFSVAPQMWQRRRREQRESLALADPKPGHAKYFRLDPYVSASPQEFSREDDAHHEVLKWISESLRPVLFLSGVSGAGKSSVPEGFVVPMLREALLPSAISKKRSTG